MTRPTQAEVDRLRDCSRILAECVERTETMKFLAYNPDNCTEDDACAIDAFDAQDAAEKYAEWADSHSAEYTYARAGGAVPSVQVIIKEIDNA